MAIEAPISKYTKNNFKIYIALCMIAAFWFAYDGYFNEKFMAEHTENGQPNSTLVFNRKAPPFLVGAAILLGIYMAAIRNKKLVAEETALVINDREKIPYDSVQKIDKTYFDSKGFFILTYKNENSKEVNRKITERSYDNLRAILDHLVEKIS
jgi:hypothetical protein